MEVGRIHLYYGDGKGKTTCAMGLALRCAGRGLRVVIAQFLKGSDSGERQALARLPEVTLLEVPPQMKFVFAMDSREKDKTRQEMTALFEKAAGMDCDLLVLDELCSALTLGLVPEGLITAFLDTRPAGLEVVITGRDPAESLLARADYATELRKRKHPYDRGEPARLGIEW